MSGSKTQDVAASATLHRRRKKTTTAGEDPTQAAEPQGEELRARVRRRLFDGADAQPRRIGRFDVTEQLGAGGMSVVYAAWDRELEREVAIKLLSGTGDRIRLQREAKAMAKLAHPNVAAVYDVGTHEGEVYVAMEYVRGRTLREWVERGQPAAEIVDAFVQAGQGLHAAHEAGVVHRDFKPDNVLVGDDGRVRVLDFGLAKAADETREHPSHAPPTNDLSLTRTGALLGTPRYMAPEQFASEPATPATDQFAFCVALYEALVGRRPYDGRSLADLAQRVTNESPRTPGPDELDPALWAVLRRGLSRDPADRHPSMAAVCEALREVMNSAPQPSKWRRTAGVVTGAVALGAIAVWAQASELEPPRDKRPRHGTLAQSDVQAVKARHEAALRACQDREREAIPGLHGRVTVDLVVGADGRVVQAESNTVGLFDASGKGVALPSLLDCLVAEARSWKFPAPKGGAAVQVSFPVVVDPGV